MSDGKMWTKTAIVYLSIRNGISNECFVYSRLVYHFSLVRDVAHRTLIWKMPGNSPVYPQNIIVFCHQLHDFSSYFVRSEVSASIIVLITLANIWRSHFRTLFDRTPFTTAAVLAGIWLDILKRIDEDDVHTILRSHSYFLSTVYLALKYVLSY